MKEWMTKLTPALLAVALAGCGGSGGDVDQRAPRIDVSIGAGVAGPASAPTLKSQAIETDSTVEYNSVVTGTIGEDSELVVTFVAPADKTTLVHFRSDARDADISVIGSGVNMTSAWMDTSNEILVFDATANGQYSVEIYNDSGAGGNFTLTIVEANRASAGLASNEYLVALQNTSKDVCVVTEDGETQTREDESVFTQFHVVSWKKGYMTWGFRKLGFQSTKGNSFTVTSTIKDSFEGLSSTTYLTAELKLTASTGKIQGTSTDYHEEVSDDGSYRDRCDTESTIAGEIIL